MESRGGFLVDEKGVSVGNTFFQFLKSFKSEQRNELYYEREIEAMRANESNTMFIDFDHIIRFSDPLQKAISDEYLRFEPYLQNACKRFVMELKPTFISDDSPISVAFYNIPIIKQLRELGTAEIGRLVSVTGMVTWTSEVGLELLQGTFKCLECRFVILNVEQQFKYTQPTICARETCNNRRKWALLHQESKLTDWQRVRMQEISKDSVVGFLPRSLDVILRHEMVGQAGAGDTVIFTGTVVVIPDKLALASPGERSECHREASQRMGSAAGNEGVSRALGVRDLSYRLAFLANSVQICDGRRKTDIRNRKKDADEDDQQFTPQELDEVQRLRNTPDFFTKLVESIAPTIYGHQDIKQAILLMLMGGVHKSTHEGISLRGDINVCIVGDPSCAKSQFLKYTSSTFPRSVYTSGKSSSAAGLTATVAKEPETGEFSIEPGALMLADNGICCIDEFDKMGFRDRDAIHEPMEQQTITITKAGLHARFHARAPILAAANPAGGRYDKSKSLGYNVALPPAILSRFDLVYVMIDEPDDAADYNIAHFIVRTRQKREAAVTSAFSPALLQRYVAYAKTLKPKLMPDARKLLVESYVHLRMEDRNPASRFTYRMTVRQLEALIRLSEAIARSHLEIQVKCDHVKLAVKLLKTSIIRVGSSETDLSEFQDPNLVDGTGSGDGNDNNRDADGQAGNSTAQQAAGADENPADGSNPKEKKLTVSDEYFQRVTRALVTRLRQHEETVMQEGTGLAGMRQRDLIRWYVNRQNEENVYSSMELVAAEISKIKAIIESLIRREGHLIVVDDGREAAAEAAGAEQPASASIDDRILAVVPTYVID